MNRAALFVQWVLGIIAAVFLLVGIAFMFFPVTMIGSIGIDLEVAPKQAAADVRAVYGGLDLAIGIFLLFCLVRKHFPLGLAVAALVCACMVLGRTIGIMQDGANDALTFGLLGIEVLGGVLAAVGWFLARQPEGVPAAVPVTTSEPVSTSEPVVRSEPGPIEPGAAGSDTDRYGN